jgi:hypothetical protein
LKRLGVIAFLTVALHLVAMGLYLQNALSGQINFHILPAEMFGVPHALAEKGIEPFYYGEGISGWDGQFYYYIANDLFARGDTPQHVDAPAYRYQRIGFSLFAKVVSSLTLKDWVSPAHYYASYLFLVFFGTLAAGAVLRRYGSHPAWAMLWSVGVGTQLTILNGLPDAAADAFLLISIALLLARWRAAAAVSLSFCLLAREIYVVFPLLLGLLSLIDCVRNSRADDRVRSALRWSVSKDALLLAVPVVVFLSWQVFIRLRFGVSPSEQAVGILGPPLWAWAEYLASGLRNNHLLLGAGIGAKLESISLVLFLAVLLISIACALAGVLAYWRKRDVIGQAVAVTTIVFAITYCFFGSVVMMHYTGYMKAATIFFFFIPLLSVNLKSEVNLYAPGGGLEPWWHIGTIAQTSAKIIVVLAFAFTDYYYWTNRIIPKQDVLLNRYANRAAVTTGGDASCLQRFDTELRVVSREDSPYPKTLFNSVFRRERASVVWVEVTNRTGSYISSLRGKGGVNISYQWMSSDGEKVMVDGIRTAMSKGLEDGETGTFPVVVKYPRVPGDYILRFSPVQEGCLWFYQSSNMSAADEKVTIR